MVRECTIAVSDSSFGKLDELRERHAGTGRSFAREIDFGLSLRQELMAAVSSDQLLVLINP